jgi:hypothetical protein
MMEATKEGPMSEAVELTVDECLELSHGGVLGRVGCPRRWGSGPSKRIVMSACQVTDAEQGGHDVVERHITSAQAPGRLLRRPENFLPRM